MIYALDKGQILECGTHEELMQKRGTYYNLVIAQEAGHKKDKNNNLNDDSDSDDEQGDDIVKNKKIYLKSKSKEDQIVDNKIQNENETKEEENSKQAETKQADPNLMRVFSFNKPEWFIILIGSLSSFLAGILIS